MKTHLKFLLGLVLMVFVFSGCQDPSRFEIPEGAIVEFVWATDSQVSSSISSNKQVYSDLYRYFSDLHEEEKDKWVFKYPKGYDESEYDELYMNKNNDDKYFKELCEKVFEEALGSKYYKKGTTIDLTNWTSEAKDLISGDSDPCYMQLYFLAEDVKKEKDGYINYVESNSFDTIEVHNENIKVYVYWYYSDK